MGDLPAGIGFALMLWSLAHRESRVLSAKPVVWLGTVSFGVYLWHYPVLYALQMHERMPERFVPAIALVLRHHVRARVAELVLRGEARDAVGRPRSCARPVAVR